ncbi:unnamed protein product [Closterium sp. NIES-65]|nr:unnamed protein product [Closterium sp. NIES-65]
MASREVVLIDPTKGSPLASLRAFKGPSGHVPFPNKCPAHPFRGEWRSVAFGPAQRTLLAAASYSTTGALRLPELTDALHVFDTVAADVTARVSLNNTPDSVYFVPIANEVWVHAADVADRYSFSILSAQPPYTEVHSQGINTMLPAGRARLLQSPNLGTRGYLTTSGSSGVYTVDLARPSTAPALFLSFQEAAAVSQRACPGALSSAYARVLRHTFVSCALPPAASPVSPADGGIGIGVSEAGAGARKASVADGLAGAGKLATVQIDARTNRIVAVWPFAGELYMAPDESFLFVLDATNKAIHMLQLSAVQPPPAQPNGQPQPTPRPRPNVTAWQPLTFNVDYTPLRMVFTPKGGVIAWLNTQQLMQSAPCPPLLFLRPPLPNSPIPHPFFITHSRTQPPHYLVYISVSEGGVIGRLDMQQLMQCGSGCSAGNMQSFVQFEQQMGENSPPRGGLVLSRPVAAGGGYVCQVAAYDRSIVCLEEATGQKTPYANISDVQHLINQSMAPEEGEGNCVGYAAHDASGVLAPWIFNRREVGRRDVKIRITHCGVCHSDVHFTRNDWGYSLYPMVPGHEIVGVVEEVGAQVSKVAVEQRVGVMGIMGSCGECEACRQHEEQFCAKCLFTSNSVDPHSPSGEATYGGYSFIVCDEHFVLSIPAELASDVAAPLLCAGTTVYSPMMHYGANKPGMRLGVAGLGGLGHVAVQMGRAFGMHVTVLSIQPEQERDARELFGADQFILTTDAAAMKAAAGSLDVIIDTVPVQHELGPFLDLLTFNGELLVLGIPVAPFTLRASQLVFGRKMVAGGLVGGIKETQEMLKFCAKKGVAPIVERLDIKDINKAHEQGEGNCVGYAARDASGELTPWRFHRREVGPGDVKIRITHCGVCHSDVHLARNEWGNSMYPIVPGHEIIGVVVQVGADVSKVAAGQRVGVGCMVGSCGECVACRQHEEQSCPKCVFTYNSVDPLSPSGQSTYGGYSSFIICNEHCVLSIPAELASDVAAPLLCAGITVYSPMMRYGANKPGMRLGVAGLGGLGHVAVQMGRAFGMHVTVLSTSQGKEREAREVMGAHRFIVTKDADAMKVGWLITALALAPL